MIIKLLSDSKEIMRDDDEDLSKHKAHALIDEKEYYIFTVVSSSGSEIWLKEPVSNKEITSGDLYDMIDSFWTEDASIFENDGKEREVYFFDGNKIFPIFYFNYNNEFVYNSDLRKLNKLAELINTDINVIKYLGEFFNEQDCFQGDLNLWQLEEIPDFLNSIFSKLKGSLTLYSVKTLTENAALALSKQIGDLDISGIKSISDTAAEYLSQHIGNLNLSGLESLSDISAEHLSKHVGLINLERLENISKEGIIHLLNHRGTTICKGELYNAYRESYSSFVKFEKILFDENDLSFIYLSIVPVNGICIDFIKNSDSSLDVVLGKNNTIPISDLLQALGLSLIDILNLFNIHFSHIKNNKESLSQVLGKRFAERVCRSWTEDFVDEDTGKIVSLERNELLYNVNDVITNEAIEVISELPIENILILDSISNQSEIYFNSILKGTANNSYEAKQKLYLLINLNDPANDDITNEFVESFASGATIKLGTEARKSLNGLLNISEAGGEGLYKSDYIDIIRFLINQ